MDLVVVMCDERNGYPQSTSTLPSETLVNQPDAVVGMDASATVAAGEDAEAPPRIKFLCSFGGSILPRPLDGKLRYVGGETRIVSVPRDVSYDELMSRMQEIFEGAAVLKYQQPDEDLDALVSVVNDDDVMNMMEEYDKLGAGDGFTRLRLFLFSHPDHDASPRFDSNERETERRYVDALNSLTDAAPEFRKLQPDLERIHGGEQLYGTLSGGEVGGLHNQWNPECSLPPINVHHIAVPHTLPHSARYNEMEAPWSPAYYSPGPQVPHDARSISEFPSSPSSGRYRMPFGDLHDKTMDRMAEEYGRHPAFVETVVWIPPGVIGNDKAGFPGNLGHSHNVFEGNNICGHCHMTFQRNQAVPEGRYPDSRWRHGQSSSHIDQPGTGNEFTQFPTPCTECLPGRETYALNPDTKLDHGIYSKEQSEQRPFYNDTHNQERGWVLHHHQTNHHAEEARTPVSGAGRVSEHYVVDGGTSVNFPFAHDGHTVSSNCINHDDPRYIQSGIELGNEGFHDQTVGAGHHMHVPPLEDCGIRYGNLPAAYGMDNHYQVPHGSTTMHSLWRKVQNPIRGGPSYEASGLLPQANSTANPGFLRGEGSPRLTRVGVEDQNPWVGHYCGPQQKVFGFDGSAAPEYPHDHAVKPNSIILQENQQLYTLEPIPCQPEMLDISVPLQAVTLVPSPSTVMEDQVANSTISGYHLNPISDTDMSMTMTLGNEQNVAYEAKHGQPVKEPDVKVLSSLKGDQVTEYDSNDVRSAVEDGNATKLEEGVAGAHNAFAQGEFSAQCLSYLPDLIASVKKAALEGAEAKVKGNDDAHVSPDADIKQTSALEADPVNANNEMEHDSDSDQPDISKIEPTKAEEEALARGLQTIKNDDLEEIRMLGSGTYGAVYHSKWKGCDVAIKRIKASCFAGKPSERERLIADFWKEALILSSLHHPNVVSFYGIVRDGPDGTLATVTEFMVNGSLKQFLQKKDRTIDRRKRLIIAMDAAFGMEYLHGKNIVHFDLKCENLLVNMRDPHRPVCKIGDLGLSKVKQHTLVSGGIRGTLPWMAPELLSGKSSMVTEKIDIYSFGIVMWELLTGEEPYGDMHCASIIGGIVNNTLRPQIPTWCDPEWKSLMESCWSSDPGERPSFSEISQKLRKMAAAMNVK
ncbi:hypothetical protein MRB53_008901 [Persea americana]|uniref:Uncharacterized protein n=1 Tax=Persea americana TaxID=3435 RepID=A0ACC2LNL1_PERAE|nr:hypothetical protein MRB53_008901 [Persea americana]